MIKNFSVNVQMEERWVPFFCSFLKNLEHNSNIGQSYVVGFYADGDGDFRSKFEIGTEFEVQSPHKDGMILYRNLYDAG